jgi:hypothetical protein
MATRRDFRPGIEAARLGLAYEYDPYFSLSISRVDPLPHRLEPRLADPCLAGEQHHLAFARLRPRSVMPVLTARVSAHCP